LGHVGGVCGVASNCSGTSGAQSAVHVKGVDRAGHRRCGGSASGGAAQVHVVAGVTQSCTQRATVVVNMQAGAGLFVQCAGAGGVGCGSPPLGAFTTSA